ncbi:hypothetical protein O6B97_06405 [Campylobacter ureolyticus]|uniref:hypothetical protein n=1 Tax=Campylobacter ureolyticus TaxID=827 RepID=UPI0022B4310A|nr:hypothetical protein [Campylobacter ureolyticus]MCZ6174611.1 hypothetical protein [Campylobacter ureolyticus]MCZ6186720.1 hypothetical protein [Campylobacter ureolyticus]
MKIKQKFATPIALWSFLVIELSGVLLFIDIKTKNLVLIHEYVGLILILGIFLHSMANLRPFKSYFTKEKGAVFGAVFIVICVIFCLFYPHPEKVKKGKILNDVLQTSLNKSVGDILFYFDIDKNSFLKFCSKNSFDCSNLEMNLKDFAAINSKKPNELAIEIFTLKSN